MCVREKRDGGKPVRDSTMVDGRASSVQKTAESAL